MRFVRIGIRNGLWLIRILHLEETVVSITGRNLATDNAVPQHPDFPGWCEAAFNIDGVIDTMETTTKEGFFMNALRLAPRRMVKALAAGAVLVASALPLVAATEAGAVVVPASSYLHLTAVGLPAVPTTVGADGVTPIFGAGWSGTGVFYLNATAAALLNGSGSASVTTTAAGVSFSSNTEGAGTVATTITSTATVPAGFYPVTITDSGGTVTIPNAYYVDPAPTITSISPTTLPSNATNVSVTVTGTGFTPNATGQIVSAGNVTIGTNLIYASPTTMTGTVSTNVAVGLYTVSIINGDGAPASSSTVGITVTGPTITSVSPTSVAIPAVAASAVTTTLTITGTNFQVGAYVTSSLLTGASLGTTTVASATSITVPLTVQNATTTTAAGRLTLTVHNPDGSSAFLAGAVGIGEASAVAPVITAVSTLPVLSAAGATASAVISGSGFGPAGSGAPTVTFATAAGTDSHVTCGSPTVISDTQISCLVTVTLGAYAGVHSVTVLPAGLGSTVSAAFANAVTVSGPVITAISPAVVPYGFVGTLSLTGSGFTVGNAAATATSSTVSGTAGDVVCTTSTTCSVKITGSTAAAGSKIIVTLTDGSGIATAFAITVVSAPTFSSVVYATGTTGVGMNSTNQPVLITGAGFLPGATVTFGSASGITATVVSVAPTAIVANISVGSATAGPNTFTITNTTGGYVTGTLTVDPALVVTASPTGFLAGAKAVTLTITGTGFSSATKLATSSSLITLGTATVVSATTITVPVTVASVTGTYIVNWTLAVTNADGGSSSVALTVNPGPTVTGTYYVPTFSTNYQILVTGTGFMSGMTVKSSNTDYSVAVAQVVSPSSLVLLVTTTSAATAGTSSNVTLTNTDGSAVTFVLNGGPVPTPVPVLTQPHVTGVSTFVKTGMTRAITLTGLHFMKGLSITSVAGTTWKVMGVSPTAVRVQVTVTSASHVGWHRLTLTNPGGKSTTRAYQQK